MKPTLMVIDCKEPLTYLFVALAHPELPTIDPDVLLTKIVDSLIHRQTYRDELHYVCSLLETSSDELFDCKAQEQSAVYILAIDVVRSTILHLTEYLHQRLLCYGLYEEDFFKYEFERIINNDNLLLKRIPRS